MDVILNELSLSGQFNNENDFLENLKEIIKITHLFLDNDLILLKSHSFWSVKITNCKTIHDLLLTKGSDVVKKLKIDLLKLSSNPPYWEEDQKHSENDFYVYKGQNINNSGIAESIERDKVILSFQHNNFSELRMDIEKNKNKIIIDNLSSFKYFIEFLFNKDLICEYKFCKYFFDNSNLNFDLLDNDNRGFMTIPSTERNQFISQFKTFSTMSWKEINDSDGLEFKKYKNTLSKFEDKDIYKFRITQKHRCFGFRDGSLFKVVHFETDHKLSDKG